MSSAPTANLHRLPGGLRLPGFKAQSATGTITEVALSRELILPLRQHAGDAAEPVVEAGERVLRGQPLARASVEFSAAVHAPAAGTVKAIETREIPGRTVREALCVILETDDSDEAWAERSGIDNPFDTAPDTLLEKIGEAGIVGLGGAAFPTRAKLRHAVDSGVDTLILNGVECEPYISCDDALMRQHAVEILYGARILLTALGLRQCAIGIESDKPDAWAAMSEAASVEGDDRVQLVLIPTVYPSGGEDQLVYLLTGREVPSGGFPSDVGAIVHNVATAAAVADLALNGNPLTSRIVTVTGEGVAQPGNYRVRFGTPIADVIAAAGGYTEQAKRLIMGGPMTGVALHDDAMPVTKACNCLIATGPAIRKSKEPERPCIRCGECARICPVRLQPQQLLRVHRHGETAELDALGLVDCIECGCCDLVCPSHIPLTQSFREAKLARRIDVYERERADRARERFERRQQREREREARDAEQTERIKQGATPEAIAEILARKQREGDD